jgi:cell division protein FtsW (lipid II flippase)
VRGPARLTRLFYSDGIFAPSINRVACPGARPILRPLPGAKGLPRRRSLTHGIMKRLYLLLMFAVLCSGTAFAQSEPQRVSQLEHRVSTLEQKIRQVGDQGLVLFLFGAFCALWAQNSGRSGWLWFFLGLFFSVITVLVLLAKNSEDNDRRRMAAPRS